MRQKPPVTRRTLYTVTPNPALDVSGAVKNLTPNEKNTVYDERRDPGGNGINASRIAHRLGTATLALGFIGGASGEELLRALDQEQVPHAFDPISGSTRINITVSDCHTHSQTRLSFAGPSVNAHEQKSLLHRMTQLPSKSLLLLGGSLPPGTPPHFHAKLAALAQKTGVGILLDVPSRTLQKSLERRAKQKLFPLLVKPNETELAQWWTKQRRSQFKSETELLKAGYALAKRASLVCVSRGATGVIVFYKDQAWRYQAPPLQARGTVGAGDSFLGGLASGLLSSGLTSTPSVDLLFSKTPRGQIPAALHEAILLGMSCGAATAAEKGTSLAKPARIRKLLKVTRRLNRSPLAFECSGAGHH